MMFKKIFTHEYRNDEVFFLVLRRISSNVLLIEFPGKKITFPKDQYILSGSSKFG